MTAPRTTFYAPALDGVRAVAFAVVFCSHVPGLGFFPGGFGVTVFFFLSGYLITTLLRIEHANTGRIDLPKFYGRRFLRIFPPYYLTLGGFAALAAAGAFAGGLPSGSALGAQLAFLGNYWLVAYGDAGLIPGSEVYWSLAVEEHFYLLFPWVAWALLARVSPRGWGPAVWAACGGVLLWRLALWGWLDPGDADRLTYATDTRIDSIGFGCAMALGANPALDKTPGWLSSPVTAAAALLAVVATLIPRDPAFRETARYTVQGLLLTPLYAHLLARPQGFAARALSNPWLRWIGVLSYTLYLVHDAAIHLAHEWLPGVPWLGAGAIALVGSIAYAQALHRIVDAPLARVRARMR